MKTKHWVIWKNNGSLIPVQIVRYTATRVEFQSGDKLSDCPISRFKLATEKDILADYRRTMAHIKDSNHYRYAARLQSLVLARNLEILVTGLYPEWYSEIMWNKHD